MNEEFRCICSWCGLVIREGNTSRTSHSCCEKCMAKHFPGVDLGAVNISVEF